MNKIKFILVAVALFFVGSIQAQAYGGLRVSALKTSSLDMKEMEDVDSVYVLVTNRKTGEDTTFLFTNDKKNRPNLKAGEYRLVCSVEGEEDRIIERVTVRAEMITMVDLLYEPKQKLNFFQKRKRRKQDLIFE